MLELALVFEPSFSSKQFYQPTMDFQNNELFIVLDSQVDDKIFNTLMTSWLNYSYDNQPLDQKFIELMENNEVVLSGGLCLTMNGKTIYPSCCAEFSDFKEWAKITKGEQVDIWLGHDPMPYIRYKGNYILVISDDETNPDCQDIFELKFSYQEFNQAFRKIIGDILVIKQFGQQWAIKHLPKELQQPFIKAFDQYFDLNL